jgi:hypothetical protein
VALIMRRYYRPDVSNPPTSTWWTLWGVDYQGRLGIADKSIMLGDTHPFPVLASDGSMLWTSWDISMSFINTAGKGAWELCSQREASK